MHALSSKTDWTTKRMNTLPRVRTEDKDTIVIERLASLPIRAQDSNTLGLQATNLAMKPPPPGSPKTFNFTIILDITLNVSSGSSRNEGRKSGILPLRTQIPIHIEPQPSTSILQDLSPYLCDKKTTSSLQPRRMGQLQRNTSLQSGPILMRVVSKPSCGL
ncbi:Hypothetical protein FKW44_022468 [Caligus rogercresseyi]|uniref:Uncharacterized protein n=1 Tax=Caligus rogercresseyi TaxID=217165 RepID=A0A7T8GN00_CALRO|nr:Hypothetical protein FKW44_022468 [Caligus rogercresseyi]